MSLPHDSTELTDDQAASLAEAVMDSASGLSVLTPGSKEWREQLDHVLGWIAENDVKDGRPLSAPTHEDFSSMIRDLLVFVRTRPEGSGELRVLPADDPMSLLIGLAAFYSLDGEEQCFHGSVKIHRLKGFGSLHPHLRGLLPSADGRRKLCVLLARGVDVLDPSSDLSI